MRKIKIIVDKEIYYNIMFNSIKFDDALIVLNSNIKSINALNNEYIIKVVNSNNNYLAISNKFNVNSLDNYKINTINDETNIIILGLQVNDYMDYELDIDEFKCIVNKLINIFKEYNNKLKKEIIDTDYLNNNLIFKNDKYCVYKNNIESSYLLEIIYNNFKDLIITIINKYKVLDLDKIKQILDLISDTDGSILDIQYILKRYMDIKTEINENTLYLNTGNEKLDLIIISNYNISTDLNIKSELSYNILFPIIKEYNNIEKSTHLDIYEYINKIEISNFDIKYYFNDKNIIFSLKENLSIKYLNYTLILDMVNFLNDYIVRNEDFITLHTNYESLFNAFTIIKE